MILWNPSPILTDTLRNKANFGGWAWQYCGG
jgi:hypothetical protein